MIAVLGLGPDEILAALERRLERAPEEELAEGLRQVARIVRLRLEEAVAVGAGRLTTHVLDLAAGRPAAGLRVQLFRLDEGGEPRPLADVTTNADGRTDRPLLEGPALAPGVYELVFHVADYFRARGLALPEPPFFDRVPVRFGIADPGGHYHVPLLVAPWGYSSYRGS